jgi:hypothetical protein
MKGPSFVVERFGWGAPDRLEVVGTFTGLMEDTSGGAVLTVVGDDGPHRLPAIGSAEDRPADGSRWEAEFAWLEAPVAFDHARLELGTSLAVELPAPGEAADGDELAVELLEDGADTEPPEHAAVDADAQQLRLEARLLDQFRAGLAQVRSSAEEALEAAQLELAETRSELEAVRGELDEARATLAAAHAEAKALANRLSGRR